MILSRLLCGVAWVITRLLMPVWMLFRLIRWVVVCLIFWWLMFAWRWGVKKSDK